MLLPTCIRCRSRRKKCDSLLPACSSCAKADSECMFRDEALQETFPRRYLQSLNDRAQELSAQLALHQCRSRSELVEESQDPNASSSPTTTDHHSTSTHVDTAGLGGDLNFNPLFPSRMTVIAFEVLTASHGSSISGPNPGLDFDLADPVAPNISLTDRSVLSPNVVRYLLGRYGTCFAPRYNLLEPELLTNDGVSFKKLEDVAKAKILLACAAAAAHEAYRMPSWRSVAQICRDWADELLTPVLAPGNKDAVTMTVMLLVFELAEPSRGLAWDLLNLATRMCLQLGWLHRPQLSDLASSSTATASEEQIYHGGPSDQENLVATLRDIDRTLQGVFYRPSMLNTPKQLAIGVRVIQDQTMIFGIRAQIYEEIYGQGRVFENRACPFVGELATLLHALESLQNDQSHLMLLEALLLLLPVCVKHKQCISCFQEPDELPETRGMRSLRLRVSEAAAQIISTVHETTVAAGKFTPPFAACVSVFSAGCCLVTAAAKGWTPLRAHTKDILNCTEVLTLFSMQWKGGRRYLHVWRTLTALLDFT